VNGTVLTSESLDLDIRFLRLSQPNGILPTLFQSPMRRSPTAT
jgi:hypothetical protein